MTPPTALAPRLRPLAAVLLSLLLLASSPLGAVARVLDDDVPREKAKKPKLKEPVPLPEITHRVYLDVVLKEKEPRKGRITLGLFGKLAPKATENFRSLCACDRGKGRISGKPLCYEGTTFHRIIPNFIVQGGDITENSGVGGESIFGGYFEDESFEVPHNRLYMLSMANKGRRDTNSSQFFINTVKTSWLDGKNVVFGMVLSGFETVDDIEAVGSNSGTPEVTVEIKESGELPPDAVEEE